VIPGALAAWHTAGDPYWSYVVALLYFRGADTSTTITDEKGHSFSVAGNAQIDTDQYKFDTSSLLCDGTGDYVSSSDHADWEMGAGNFTIEGFIRIASLKSFNILVSKRANASSVGPFVIYGEFSGAISCALSSTGSSWDIGIASFGTTSANTWHHFAVVRNGTSFKGYLDGTGTTLATSSASLVDNAQPLIVGADLDSHSTNGWLGPIRITKGIARYTADFTPPIVQFPNY